MGLCGRGFLALLWLFIVKAGLDKVNVSTENIAASGCDPVSYFSAQPDRSPLELIVRKGFLSDQLCRTQLISRTRLSFKY